MDLIGSIPAAVLVLLVGIPLGLAFVFGRQLWRLWRSARGRGARSGGRRGR